MRIRTGYSFRTAVGHLPEVMARLKAIGSTVAPITDRMSTFGFVQWTKLCEKEGLRPLYGVEIGVIPEYKSKPSVDWWTFIAKDDLRPLHDLIYQASLRQGSYLTYEAALKAPLIKIAGSYLLVDALPAGPLPFDFFFGHAPSNPGGLLKRVQRRGIRMVAVSDNHYPTEADREFYRLAMGRPGRSADTQTWPQHILDFDEWLMAVPGRYDDDHKQAENDILAMATATLKTAKLFVPPKPATLGELCRQGAAAKSIDLRDTVYHERLNRELRMIADKGFEDYFYIIADIVGWARQKMVVGPARGSAAGSLVCYLLDITTIDPIPYGLIFERFIDVNRSDLPDIDIDFSDTNRALALEYATARFGSDHVARLGTVGTFKPRSAIVQVGTGLGVPGWKLDRITDNLIEHAEGDERFNKSLEDTFVATMAGQELVSEYPEVVIASRLEGHPNVPSQHAAGLLITDKPIRDYVAVDARTKAAWIDKKSAEALNLLKVDALGLTQLSIFERTLELAGIRDTRFLESVPLDDSAAFAVLNEKRFSGIFQFSGQALRRLAADVHFTSLNDIVALTALARPGPLGGGGAASWIARKMGREPVEAVHPILDQITKETYGIIVYQETVMQIVREVGGFDWKDVSAIRRLISLKLGAERLMTFWPRFRDGAVKRGMSEAVARDVWEAMRQFGSYAFNKSHSVAYGVISYWCCWLKAHYAVQFAAATLDAEPDPEKQIAILRELDAEGVTYLAVDVQHSVDRWAINGTTLIGPLSAIKGIGPVKMNTIMQARQDGKPLTDGLAKMLKNAKTPIDSLYPVRDRVAQFDLPAVNVVTTPRPIAKVADAEPGDFVVIVGVAKRLNPKNENAPDAVARRNGRRIEGEAMALNIFLADDTEEILCRVNRRNFDAIAKPIIERGGAGRAIYAIGGTVVQLGFRMIDATNARYLGDLND